MIVMMKVIVTVIVMMIIVMMIVTVTDIVLVTVIVILMMIVRVIGIVMLIARVTVAVMEIVLVTVTVMMIVIVMMTMMNMTHLATLTSWEALSEPLGHCLAESHETWDRMIHQLEETNNKLRPVNLSSYQDQISDRIQFNSLVWRLRE